MSFCDEVGGKADTGRDPPFTMPLHLECAHYEKHGPDAVVPGWYEDVSEPAFDRAEALKFCSPSP